MDPSKSAPFGLPAALLAVCGFLAPASAQQAPQPPAVEAYQRCVAQAGNPATSAFLSALRSAAPAGRDAAAERRAAALAQARQALEELSEEGGAGEEACPRLIEGMDHEALRFFATSCGESAPAALEPAPHPPLGLTQILTRLSAQCLAPRPPQTAAYAAMVRAQLPEELLAGPGFPFACRVAAAVLTEVSARDWERLAAAQGFAPPRCRFALPLPRQAEDLQWFALNADDNRRLFLRVARTLCEGSVAGTLPAAEFAACRAAFNAFLPPPEFERLFGASARPESLASVASAVATCRDRRYDDDAGWTQCLTRATQAPAVAVAEAARVEPPTTPSAAGPQGSSSMGRAFDGSAARPAAPSPEGPAEQAALIALPGPQARPPVSDARPGPAREEAATSASSATARSGAPQALSCAAAAAAAELPLPEGLRGAPLSGVADCRRETASGELAATAAQARRVLERLRDESPGDRALQHRLAGFLADLDAIPQETDPARRSRLMTAWMSQVHRFLTTSRQGFLGEEHRLAARDEHEESAGLLAERALRHTRVFRGLAGEDAPALTAALERYLADPASLSEPQRQLIARLTADRAGSQALERLSHSVRDFEVSQSSLTSFRQSHPEFADYQQALGRYQQAQQSYISAALARGAPEDHHGERMFLGLPGAYVAELGSRYGSWGLVTESRGGTWSYRSADGRVTAGEQRDSQGSYALVQRHDAAGRLTQTEIHRAPGMIGQSGRWDSAGNALDVWDHRADGSRHHLVADRDRLGRITLTAEEEFAGDWTYVGSVEHRLDGAGRLTGVDVQDQRGWSSQRGLWDSEGAATDVVEHASDGSTRHLIAERDPQGRALLTAEQDFDSRGRLITQQEVSSGTGVSVQYGAPGSDSRMQVTHFDLRDGRASPTRTYAVLSDGRAAVALTGSQGSLYYADPAEYDRDPAHALPSGVAVDLAPLVAARGDPERLAAASRDVVARVIEGQGQIHWQPQDEAMVALWLADAAREARTAQVTVDLPPPHQGPSTGHDPQPAFHLLTEDQSGRRFAQQAQFGLGAETALHGADGRVTGITLPAILAVDTPIALDADGRPLPQDQQTADAGLVRQTEYLRDGGRRQHHSATTRETSWLGAVTEVRRDTLVDERTGSTLDLGTHERPIESNVAVRFASAAASLPIIHQVTEAASLVGGTLFHGIVSGGERIVQVASSSEDYELAALASSYRSEGLRAMYGRQYFIDEINHGSPGVRDVLTMEVQRRRRESLEAQGWTADRLGAERYRQLVDEQVSGHDHPVSDDELLAVLEDRYTAGHALHTADDLASRVRYGRGLHGAALGPDLADVQRAEDLRLLGVTAIAGEQSANGLVLMGGVGAVGRLGALGTALTAEGTALGAQESLFLRGAGLAARGSGAVLSGTAPELEAYLHGGMQLGFAAGAAANVTALGDALTSGRGADSLTAATQAATDLFMWRAGARESRGERAPTEPTQDRRAPRPETGESPTSRMVHLSVPAGGAERFGAILEAHGVHGEVHLVESEGHPGEAIVDVPTGVDLPALRAALEQAGIRAPEGGRVSSGFWQETLALRTRGAAQAPPERAASRGGLAAAVETAAPAPAPGAEISDSAEPTRRMMRVAAPADAAARLRLREVLTAHGITDFATAAGGQVLFELPAGVEHATLEQAIREARAEPSREVRLPAPQDAAARLSLRRILARHGISDYRVVDGEIAFELPPAADGAVLSGALESAGIPTTIDGRGRAPLRGATEGDIQSQLDRLGPRETTESQRPHYDGPRPPGAGRAAPRGPSSLPEDLARRESGVEEVAPGDAPSRPGRLGEGMRLETTVRDARWRTAEARGASPEGQAAVEAARLGGTAAVSFDSGIQLGNTCTLHAISNMTGLPVAEVARIADRLGIDITQGAWPEPLVREIERRYQVRFVELPFEDVIRNAVAHGRVAYATMEIGGGLHSVVIEGQAMVNGEPHIIVRDSNTSRPMLYPVAEFSEMARRSHIITTREAAGRPRLGTAASAPESGAPRSEAPRPPGAEAPPEADRLRISQATDLPPRTVEAAMRSGLTEDAVVGSVQAGGQASMPLAIMDHHLRAGRDLRTLISALESALPGRAPAERFRTPSLPRGARAASDSPMVIADLQLAATQGRIDRIDYGRLGGGRGYDVPAAYRQPAGIRALLLGLREVASNGPAQSGGLLYDTLLAPSGGGPAIYFKFRRYVSRESPGYRYELVSCHASVR